MRTVTFDIEGMHCEGCAGTIEHVLRRHAGVWEAEVTLETASARVLLDPGQALPGQLAEALRQAGYQASERDA